MSVEADGRRTLSTASTAGAGAVAVLSAAAFAGLMVALVDAVAQVGLLAVRRQRAAA